MAPAKQVAAASVARPFVKIRPANELRLRFDQQHLAASASQIGGVGRRDKRRRESLSLNSAATIFVRSISPKFAATSARDRLCFGAAWRVTRKCKPSALILALTLVSTLTVALSNLPSGCLCDTSAQQKVLPLSAGNNVAKQAAAKATTKAAATSSNSNNRESLLAALGESIERQHFKHLRPSLKFVAKQQRPSKFDSGSEQYLEQPLSSTNNLGKAAKSAPTKAGGAGGKRPTAAADVEMRHILMLHDSAAGASGHKTRKQTLASEEFGDETAAESAPSLSWRNLVARVPVLGATNLLAQAATTNPRNKMLSQLLSYLGPSSSSSQSADKHDADNSIAQPFPVAMRLLNATSLPLAVNPFSARRLTTGSDKKGARFLGGGGASQQSFKSQTGKDQLESSALAPINTPQVSSSSGAKTPRPGSLLSDLLGPEKKPAKGLKLLSLPLNLASQGKKQASNEAAVQQQDALETSEKVGSLLKRSANQFARSYLNDSLRDLLTLSQLPILTGKHASTAPSELEPGGKQWLANKLVAEQVWANKSQANSLDDLFRYVYLIGSGVRRKRDPLKVLNSAPPTNPLDSPARFISRRLVAANNANSGQNSQLTHFADSNSTSRRQLLRLTNRLRSLFAKKHADQRGIMWDMATDPSLAVTVFHLIERASVALPLGFLLMPFVQMIRNPLNGFNLGRILPARASHRSVDYEELARRLDLMDKVLSRALRPTHRDMAFMGK